MLYRQEAPLLLLFLPHVSLSRHWARPLTHTHTSTRGAPGLDHHSFDSAEALCLSFSIALPRSLAFLPCSSLLEESLSVCPCHATRNHQTLGEWGDWSRLGALAILAALARRLISSSGSTRVNRTANEPIRKGNFRHAWAGRRGK